MYNFTRSSEVDTEGGVGMRCRGSKPRKDPFPTCDYIRYFNEPVPDVVLCRSVA